MQNVHFGCTDAATRQFQIGQVGPLPHYLGSGDAASLPCWVGAVRGILLTSGAQNASFGIAGNTQPRRDMAAATPSTPAVIGAAALHALQGFERPAPFFHGRITEPRVRALLAPESQGEAPRGTSTRQRSGRCRWCRMDSVVTFTPRRMRQLARTWTSTPAGAHQVHCRARRH
jgi:hypothetical protein